MPRRHERYQQLGYDAGKVAVFIHLHIYRLPPRRFETRDGYLPCQRFIAHWLAAVQTGDAPCEQAGRLMRRGVHYISYVAHGLLHCPALPDKGDGSAGQGVGEIGNINLALVHRHAAHERRFPAPGKQNVAPVSQMARKAVGVTCRNRGDS